MNLAIFVIVLMLLSKTVLTCFRKAISSIFDRSITIKNIGGVVAEACLGALFLLSWFDRGDLWITIASEPAIVGWLTLKCFQPLPQLWQIPGGEDATDKAK